MIEALVGEGVAGSAVFPSELPMGFSESGEIPPSLSDSTEPLRPPSIFAASVRVFESEFTTGECSVFPSLQATELIDSALPGSSQSLSEVHINARKIASQS
jgi:hypothetical protein